jgi:hypothetical protein
METIQLLRVQLIAVAPIDKRWILILCVCVVFGVLSVFCDEKLVIVEPRILHTGRYVYSQYVYTTIHCRKYRGVR